MNSRRKARECALQMLYQIDMTGESSVRVRAAYWRENEVNGPIREFADRLLEATVHDLERIDELITGSSQNWRFDRMARVDRNLLRLAVGEFLNVTDTPRNVVINEAIEIAKKFGAAESPQFVNGVLDGIKKELEAVVAPSRT